MRAAPLLVLALLAGCQQRDQPAARQANEAVTITLEPPAGQAPPPPRPLPAEPPASESSPSGSAKSAPEPAGGVAPAPAAARDTRITNDAVIPVGFRGRWAESRAHCDRPHERELTVGAGQLAFWESEGRVEQVRAAGTRAVDVTAAFTGEGEQWTRDHRLTLDGSGDRLTLSGAGSTVMRVRCR